MTNQLSHAEVLGRYCGTFVDELVAAGVENVCLCPGSRSTPLALTFARHPGIKLWTHLDERSCAYFALGMAKSPLRPSPVAILCSSGTAAVNFAPAVVEAFHSHVPLIVLTADRPPELQGLGSNQTIDQQNLYGSAVKWFVNLPPPEASEQTLRYVRMVADRAVSTAQQDARGPVHLNFQFREPLLPAPQTFGSEGRERTEQLTATSQGSALARFAPLAEMLATKRRPLIVCGPDLPVQHDDLFALASRLKAPVLADPLSGLRYEGHPEVMGKYDAYLRVPELAKVLRPDVILRFGAPPTSKPMATFLQVHRGAEQVAIAPPATWPDPDLTAHEMVFSDASRFCRWLLEELDNEQATDEGWLAEWSRAEGLTAEVLEDAFGEVELTEASAIVDLATVLTPAARLVVGNSMPVRDLDSFWPVENTGHFVYANRGASGIDGIVSTAMGIAARDWVNSPTVLVIGDLSFYHDMNGLLAAQRFGLKATIVLINNDGGGIFSFLPQHEDAEHFETLFGTPHGLDFSHVAGLYGVGFQRVSTRQEYRDALKASFEAPGVQIIEIKTDREENLRLHQRIWDEVAKAVEGIAVPSEGGS